MNCKLTLWYFSIYYISGIVGNDLKYIDPSDFSLSASNLCGFLNEEKLIIEKVNDECISQLNETCQNATLMETFIDASSKFPYVGINTAYRYDYGNFDQCLAIDHSFSGNRILGKHCFAGLIILDPKNLTNTDMAFKLSICQPDKCSAADLTTILATIVPVKVPIMFTDKYCQTKETHVDFAAEDYVTITIIGTFVALMIISTIYDIYLNNYHSRPIHPLFIAFSIFSNGKKIFKTSPHSVKSDQILIFHGLKFISIMWITAGHGISLMESANLLNENYFLEWKKKFYAVYISTAILAVETFFFISGFLLAYQYTKIKSKPLKFHIMAIPMNIVHRYLRLTPPVLMLFLVTISIYPRISSGPIQPAMAQHLQKPCRENWWAYFLYIQNYNNYGNDDLCWVPTWYLSADMQLFLLSPLILIPLCMSLKKPNSLKSSMICLFILDILALVIPIGIKLCYKDYENTYDTHSRIITYLMGVTMGVYMRETKDKPFLSRNLSTKNISIINIVLWILALWLMIAGSLWFKQADLHGSYEHNAICYMIVRFMWATGLSWIVYSSYHGYGGFVNWLLCSPFMQVGGKITYCIYLVHPLVIFNYGMSWQTKMYFSNFAAYYLWCGYFITSVILAFFWTLAFESPLMIIEKVILGGAGGGKNKSDQRTANSSAPKINIEIIEKKDLNDNEAP